MLTSLAGGEQRLLHSFAKTTPQLSPRRLTISNAVYSILDIDGELRGAVLTFEKAALWKLTVRVGALMGKKVNPESVARLVRKYKTGR